jgi:hypothetical protein
MTFPVSFPNGNTFVPGVTINPNSSEAQIAAWVNSIGQSGAAFTTWYAGAHAKDAALTPYQGVQVWLVGTGTANAVGAAVGGTATATNQIGQGATNGLENISKDILGGFNLGSWFMRIGEILLGLVLIGVGVARITGAQNIISKAVKTKL